jgi:hypothetical protein
LPYGLWRGAHLGEFIDQVVNEAVTLLVPIQREIIQCFSAAVGKGKDSRRLEVRGWRHKEKCQMPNFKVQMSNG